MNIEVKGRYSGLANLHAVETTAVTAAGAFTLPAMGLLMGLINLTCSKFISSDNAVFLCDNE